MPPSSVVRACTRFESAELILALPVVKPMKKQHAAAAEDERGIIHLTGSIAGRSAGKGSGAVVWPRRRICSGCACWYLSVIVGRPPFPHLKNSSFCKNSASSRLWMCGGTIRQAGGGKAASVGRSRLNSRLRPRRHRGKTSGQEDTCIDCTAFCLTTRTVAYLDYVPSLVEMRASSCSPICADYIRCEKGMEMVHVVR